MKGFSMKYINIAFDDARSDTYTRAYPILNKYGFVGTINVITEYVKDDKLYNFASAKHSMSLSEIMECANNGIEIASHGHTHRNNAKDIMDSIAFLHEGGVNVCSMGFASPRSWLTEKNLDETGIKGLLEDGTISYVRSGIQVRREGSVYIAFSILERITHSKIIYWLLNRRNIIKKGEVLPILRSVAVKRFTSLNQLIYLIDHMNSDDSVCILFHSILKDSDAGYGKDDWFWDNSKFESFCRYLSGLGDVKICTTYEIAQRW